jgi:hypothetical protein
MGVRASVGMWCEVVTSKSTTGIAANPSEAAVGLRDEDLIAEVDFDELPLGSPEAGEDLDLIEMVRRRFELDEEISDVTIASSLAAIAAKDDPRSRWLAAFGSPLGKRLAKGDTDINAAISSLVALAESRLA